jgi:hypothetical protein
MCPTPTSPVWRAASRSIFKASSTPAMWIDGVTAALLRNHPGVATAAGVLDILSAVWKP